jgi:hypothetical protein
MSTTAIGDDHSALIRAVDERTMTSCMEQLQEAYVMSVASTAGVSVVNVHRDTHGVDLELVRPFAAPREEVSVKAQLKSSTRIKFPPGADFFSYQFSKREYLERLIAPRKWKKYILIVMAVHPHQDLWTDCSQDFLRLRHCCYWECFEGDVISSAIKPTVRISTKHVFDASALTEILDCIDRGDNLCDL